jgi:hypothetical protein
MMTDQHVLYPKVGFLPFLLRSGMYRVMVFCGILVHGDSNFLSYESGRISRFWWAVFLSPLHLFF